MPKKKPEQPKTHRCGDAGGRTKAGKPCAHETPQGSRCVRHPESAVVEPVTGGRPAFEVTDAVLAEVEAMAFDGLTQEEIAWALRIGERTLRRRLIDHPDFELAYRAGRARLARQLSGNVIRFGSTIGTDKKNLKNVMSTDALKAAQWALARILGRSEKQQHEITVGRISLEDWMRSLSETELRRLDALVDKHGDGELLKEYERACPPPGN